MGRNEYCWRRIKKYLKEEWSKFLKNPHLEEWLSGHLEYGTAAARTRLIIASMNEFYQY